MLEIESLQFFKVGWSLLLDCGNPVFGKLKVFRIKPAPVHKTSRLACASARIGLIDQAAFVIHELVEIATCSGQELTGFAYKLVAKAK